ncbi:hypothetical protein GCM10029964_049870 [Kibdelosporangium lantanae]
MTSRATDAATLDVVQMALSGRVRPALVGGLLARGVRAVGLSGVDGGSSGREGKQGSEFGKTVACGWSVTI